MLFEYQVLSESKEDCIESSYVVLNAFESIVEEIDKDADD